MPALLDVACNRSRVIMTLRIALKTLGDASQEPIRAPPTAGRLAFPVAVLAGTSPFQLSAGVYGSGGDASAVVRPKVDAGGVPVAG
jgi:hypothetical protein